MKAAETNLLRLLQGSKQYIIPLFQRPYTWGQKNWETLWEDIINIYVEGPESSHFVGPIVTLALPGTPEGISPYIVIDGQQRLTTFSLLLAALRDDLLEKGGQGNYPDKLHNLYLINQFSEGESQFKILPTKMDREIYQHIILKKATNDNGRLIEAYKYFRTRISKIDFNYELSIDQIELGRIILQSLALVHITLDDKDNPYIIFESLNNKGTPLTQADLVRNYFFMRLPKERHDEVYSEIWYPIQKIYETRAGNAYLKELTNSFWYYLRKDGLKPFVLYGQVYQGIKERLETPNSNLEALLNDLLKFSRYYLYFRYPKEEDKIPLRRWFYRFLRLDFTTSYPFLFNLYNEYDKGQLSIERFEEMLVLVESYFVRRLFVGLPTNSLNKVFNTIYREIDKDCPVESLRRTLMNLEGNQIWPTDEQFCKGILDRQIYFRGKADRVKLILESIEETLTKERVDPAKLTVEHIMPQTLTKEWRKMIGPEYEEQHQIWVHTLGNLTITGYNSELSNKTFDEKLMLLSSSNVSMNKYFQGLKAWNDDAIKVRGKYLAELAIKIWPR